MKLTEQKRYSHEYIIKFVLLAYFLKCVMPHSFSWCLSVIILIVLGGHQANLPAIFVDDFELSCFRGKNNIEFCVDQPIDRRRIPPFNGLMN